MVSKKYIQDYILEYVPNKRGVLKPVPKYKGKEFCFEHDEQTVKKAKWFLAVMLVLGTFFYLVPLLMESIPCMRKYYVLVPYVAMVFPVFFAFCGEYNILTAKGQITRERRDKAQPKLKASCFLVMFMSVASLVGQIVFVAKNGFAKRCIPVFVCTLGCLVCYFVAFLRCKDVTMKEK